MISGMETGNSVGIIRCRGGWDGGTEEEITKEYQYRMDSALGHYRILDLTEGGCLIGAKILGDLGVDVVKIEPSGGSPSRMGPYYLEI